MKGIVEGRERGHLVEFVESHDVSLFLHPSYQFFESNSITVETPL